MIKLYLIRHSKTYGNTLGRYIGRRTDEPLCEEGIQLVKSREYPLADYVFSSPMIRCLQTARLIYPNNVPEIIDNLAECDFGTFENKNYKELDGNPKYQEWIDSNGMLPFPEGESKEAFALRSMNGFLLCIQRCLELKINSAAIVVHGGTIMALLDKLATPHEDYFYWQVKNACGFELELNEELWLQGIHKVKVLNKI